MLSVFGWRFPALTPDVLRNRLASAYAPLAKARNWGASFRTRALNCLWSSGCWRALGAGLSYMTVAATHWRAVCLSLERFVLEFMPQAFAQCRLYVGPKRKDFDQLGRNITVPTLCERLLCHYFAVAFLTRSPVRGGYYVASGWMVQRWRDFIAYLLSGPALLFSFACLSGERPRSACSF